MATISSLDRFLDPATGCLTPEVAERFIHWAPDPQLRARVQELGRKADEGTLTPEENLEYQQYIEEGDLIALLQAKARRILARTAD